MKSIFPIHHRDNGDYGKNMYIPCYTRIGPYIAGLVTGYLLYRLEFKCYIPKVSVCVETS